MNIWIGYAGLAMTFVVLSVIFLWFFINSHGKVAIKVLLIPVVLWYGLVLYYVPSNFLGLPVSEEIPDGSILLYIQIREPTAFYFLVLEEKRDAPQSIIYRINPKRTFEYTGNDIPRLYELPYDREMHKRLVKAQKEKRMIPGGMGIIRYNKNFLKGNKKNRKARGGVSYGDDSEFEVINPLKFLEKEHEEG